MSEQRLENLMDTTMKEIREMVDTDAIIGKTITADDGTMIIPVSKLSYGFGSGGSDFPSKSKSSSGAFGGGGGAGVTVSPVGFLVISTGKVRFIQVEPFTTSLDRIIESAPELIDKATDLFGGILEKRSAKKANKSNKANPADITATNNNDKAVK